MAKDLLDVAELQPVAEELGHKWQASHRHDNHRAVWLTHEDGRELFVSTDWRDRDRLIIHGIFPTTDDHRQVSSIVSCTTTEIGVGRNRGPSVIAREIRRRLLPEYDQEYRKAVEVIAKDKQRREARAQVAEDVAMVLHTEVHHPRDVHTVNVSVLDPHWIDVDLSLYGSCVVTVRQVPQHKAADVARAILAALAE